jgi:hypothetical protein
VAEPQERGEAWSTGEKVTRALYILKEIIIEVCISEKKRTAKE